MAVPSYRRSTYSLSSSIALFNVFIPNFFLQDSEKLLKQKIIIAIKEKRVA